MRISGVDLTDLWMGRFDNCLDKNEMLKLIWPKGNVLIEKSGGPRIGRWGTPQVMLAGLEKEITEKVLSLRYNLNWSGAALVTPTQFLKQ